MDTIKRVCPIVLGAPIVRESESVFPLARELVRIQAPCELIGDVIEVCDGQRTLDEVLDLLDPKWDRHTLTMFLEDLLEKGVLHDSSSLSKFAWPFVSNPSYFSKTVTDTQVAEMVDRACLKHRKTSPERVFLVDEFAFKKLICSRKSKRSFSGKIVGLKDILRMLWAGYGIIANSFNDEGFDRHSVPSAGALYPLRLSVVLLQSVDDTMDRGIYGVSFTPDGAVGLSYLSNNLTPLYQSFADPLILRDATGIIVVSGAFSTTEEKYGNRAMLYVPLETGHVVQNIYLAATELNIASVEIGGFLEESMRDVLVLPAEYMPLITVVFGDPSDEEERPVQFKLDVRWMPTKGGGYTLPFNLAFARLPGVSNRNDDWACGRSLDPFVAYAKACAEAQEWGACSIAHNLIMKDIDSLMETITPESIVAFHSEQYASPNFPFSPFDTENMYEWKEAANIITGEVCYVLADCIYFPYYPEYPRYASANSSGAAAYPTRTGAIERGVLELVERDAFMIVWLNRLIMPSIRISSLPDTIQYRIRKLEEVGFKVRVKDLTLDLAPVVLIFVQNENLYYTTCSACSSFDITEAMDHALMEVEAAVYCRLSFGSSEPIFPEDVRMTQDHGKIYEQECFFCKADFFQESLFLKDFGEIGKGSCLNWETLLERFTEQQRNVLVVNLENPKIDGMQSDLYIVKTFVTGLVPISFGYMEEPCGMRRIYEVPVTLGLLSESLCYDDLNRFPHPYT